MASLSSIIIPTYGRPENLSRAITSAQNQTFKNIEIIIVDDNGLGSDNQIETHKSIRHILLSDSRVKYFSHKENMNGAAARNTGVRYSSGKIIFFLDDDDEFAPNKVEVHNAEYENRKGVLFYSKCIKKKLGKNTSYSKYSKEGNITFDVLTSSCDINTSSLSIRRDAFNLIGGFDESFKRNQDYEFIIRCMKKFDIFCVNEHLTIRHLDDKTNHLSYTQYFKVRDNFIIQFSDVINSLPYWDRLTFYSATNLELSYVAFNSKNYVYMIKHLTKIIPTLKFNKILLNKVLDKL